MAHGRLGSGVVVLAILVIAGAVGLVRAQTGCAAESDVSNDVVNSCEGYLVLGSTATPTCCTELSTVQKVWGSDCYCDLLLYWQESDYPLDMTQAYTLPQACDVPVNMTSCPPSTSTSAPSASTSSPPPPAALLPPAAALLPPPAGLTPTPPGFTPPTIPDLVPSSPSKGKSSLAVPIGATAGGLTVGAVIIWVVYLIMSKCDISLKWDLNQPCCCCFRRSKAHPEKLDNNMHNVPARPYFYGV